MEVKPSRNTAPWDWVKAVCTIVLTLVLAVKIYITPTSFTVDFPTLLSLLLALFSVVLASLFYFKATDTSNTFYDNTYKFTTDVAQLLAKIESGFGERLRHLDEGYSSMRSHIESGPVKHSDEIDKAKKNLESERQELNKVVQERDLIIQTLVDRSALDSAEKERVLAELKTKQDEVEEAQRELARIKKQLLLNRIRQHDVRVSHEDGHVMIHYTVNSVLPRLGIRKVLEAPASVIREDFENFKSDLPVGYLDDLRGRGMYTNHLTSEGIRHLKSLAQVEINSHMDDE